MESQQLLTQSEVLKDEILAGTERRDHPAEEVPEPHDHGKNLNETSPAELIPKSLILQMYDVLMTHTGSARPPLPKESASRVENWATISFDEPQPFATQPRTTGALQGAVGEVAWRGKRVVVDGGRGSQG